MNYIKHLTEDILPFWLDNAIDEKQGGIFTQLDEKGNIYGTEKSVWFQGRALYIFSLAYSLTKDEKYLEGAIQRIAMILSRKLIEDNDFERKQ